MESDNLKFNISDFNTGTCVCNGRTISYRSYENVPYVSKPNAPHLQVLNIYVTEELADDHDAPIFFIQETGGMGEAYPLAIENDRRGAIIRALSEGYVVVTAGARGRDTVVNGVYVGRGELLMTIIDLKAAVRYLHYNKGIIPGNPDRIAEEGASSGGLHSALLGLTGNSGLYQKYLDDIGAAPAGDDIYCCIVNAPIMDLRHIDMAYEWMFSVDNVEGLYEGDKVSEEMSRRLAKAYEQYVNELDLKDPETGESLNFIGEDTYTPYLMKELGRSATKFLNSLSDEERGRWIEDEKNRKVLTWDGNRAEIVSMPDYIAWNSGRWMPYVGCYDGFASRPSRENEAFGSTDGKQYGHFSPEMGRIISEFPGYEKEGSEWVENANKNARAEYLINPMNFIGAGDCNMAPYWYIRCGGHHETTGDLFLNLTLKLKNCTDAAVDSAFAWNQRHTMISDLEPDETFAFLAKYVK